MENKVHTGVTVTNIINVGNINTVTSSFLSSCHLDLIPHSVQMFSCSVPLSSQDQALGHICSVSRKGISILSEVTLTGTYLSMVGIQCSIATEVQVLSQTEIQEC